MPADTPRPARGRLHRARRALTFASGLLAVVAVLNTAFTSGPAGATEAAQQEGADRALVDRGQEIFGARCALCHGETGRGIEDDGSPAHGPSLIGVGAASVDFMIRTGRMPLENANERLRHSEPHLTDAEREAVIAYVTSLAPGEGPEIPDVDGWETANLAEGMELFTTNCAACHGPTAQGIAVGQKDVSSTLDVATPLELVEAIRTGPGVMPVFGEEALPEHEVDAIVAWVMHLREREAPGGAQIGRSGPVSEGLIAWVVGLGLLTVVMYLLGEKSHGVDDAEA